MMKDEVHDALVDAFCAELKSIKDALDRNGGRFSCDREIDNAKDCIQGLKDLAKLDAVSARSIAR